MRWNVDWQLLGQERRKLYPLNDALIKCHECTGQVSDHARTCPHCSAPISSMRIQQEPLNEQEKLVCRLREEEKLTWRVIAGRLGVSVARVRQIHRAAEKKLKDFAENGQDALSLLPMRARRVVVDLGIGSRARARAAMETGHLSCIGGGSAIFWDGVMLRQLSRKTWAVLYEWAGRPELPPFQGMRPLEIRVPADWH